MCRLMQKVSEYDQKMPQSQSAYQPTALNRNYLAMLLIYTVLMHKWNGSFLVRMGHKLDIL